VGFDDDFEAESHRSGRENARSPGADEYGSVDDAYGDEEFEGMSDDDLGAYGVRVDAEGRPESRAQDERPSPDYAGDSWESEGERRPPARPETSMGQRFGDYPARPGEDRDDPFQRPGESRDDPFARPGESRSRGDDRDDPFQRPGDDRDDPFQRPGDDRDDPFQRPGDDRDDPFQRPGDDRDDPFQRPGEDDMNRPPDDMYSDDELGGPITVQELFEMADSGRLPRHALVAPDSKKNVSLGVGESQSYSLSWKNSSSAALTGVEFVSSGQLAADGPPLLTVKEHHPVSVAAGKKAKLQVSIHVPGDALEGSQDTVFVYVLGQTHVVGAIQFTVSFAASRYR
jgi:hypothetical protein